MRDDRHRPSFPSFRYLGAERLSRALGAVEEGRASRGDQRVLRVAVMLLLVPVAVVAVALLIQALR